MIKFDHLRIPVTDLARSRDWYVRTLGLKVEFEVPDRQTVALQDTDDFTIFLQEVRSPVVPSQCALWFQVADVETTFTDWSARGVFNVPRNESLASIAPADPDGAGRWTGYVASWTAWNHVRTAAALAAAASFSLALAC